MSSEVDLIRDRYARRTDTVVPGYDPMLPWVYMMAQEKERALIKLFQRFSIAPVQSKRVIEIGCGTGGNLLQLLRLGFRPENLVGNELLEERAAAARELLPAGTRIVGGDVCELDLPSATFDVVYQSTVFTSILDESFQERMARRMWQWPRPGGGVLWYDFTFDNPLNPDVRGVPVPRIRQLFPEGTVFARRITLAPPIARLLTRVHPQLYTAANLLPFLRTHVLCWIRKND